MAYIVIHLTLTDFVWGTCFLVAKMWFAAVHIHSTSCLASSKPPVTPAAPQNWLCFCSHLLYVIYTLWMSTTCHPTLKNMNYPSK